MVELDRLGRDALGEHDPQQLGGRENVAQRLVGALERDSAALADRLQAMVVGERLEQPERLERAGGRRGAVVDPCALERVLEHRQVEADVVGDEHRVAEAAPGARTAMSEKDGASATSAADDPVHRGRLGRNLAATAGRAVVYRAGLDAVRVELDERERDDLVSRRIGAGRLAVEDRVPGRNRHCGAGLGRPGTIARRLAGAGAKRSRTSCTGISRGCLPDRTSPLR